MSVKKKPVSNKNKDEDSKSIDLSNFEALVGEETIKFIFANAPRKIKTRVGNAAYHYHRAEKLKDIDEEMGAIRLIAAEEELVVAIFEWLKLNKKHFPEHGQFVRKFKNHLVKLSFHPVLLQFRWVLGDLLRQGFSFEGLEDILNWTAKLVIEEKSVKLALYSNDGKEIIRNNPLAIDISREDAHGQDVVPLLFTDLTNTIKEQTGMTLKEFLVQRADYRNKLLYATDAIACVSMGENLEKLIDIFKQTYHDLLWVLTLLLGSQPPSKEWGVVSQFIGMYHCALIEAGVLSKNEV